MADHCTRCGRELCGKPDECRDEPYLCHLEGGPDCTEWAARTQGSGVLVPAPSRHDLEVFEMDGASGTRRVVVIDCGAPAPEPGCGVAEAEFALRRPLCADRDEPAASSTLQDMPQRLTKAENEEQIRQELRRKQGRRNRW